MPQTRVKNVPEVRVAVVKRLYERANASSVEIISNGDGTSDILVTFPDEQQHDDLES